MKGLLLLSALVLSGTLFASLPPLKVKGMKLIDPAGKAVSLRGTNVGNWLVIEMWMLGLSDLPGMPGDQYELEKLLTERFGEAEKDRLMDVYRSTWITGADFKQMRAFDFNLVRLPMNYRLMEDDRHPYKLRKDAWKWIDKAVNLAEANGLYTILDMHGAQGGQSPYDHTGHSDQNKLKDDPEAQKRLAWLWGEIAKRYRSRSAVVAYDVFNEPYGTPKDIQVKVFEKALREIRKNDPEKLVFAHGNYDDFQHYGDPKKNVWHNVGFEMHYYPGLFGGGPPTVKTHLRHLQFLEGLNKTVKKYNVPFLIGEMNVVFDSAGGATMMRRYFETHAKYGWMTTMWSWKVVAQEGGVQPSIWGCVVNKNPMRKVDFRNDSRQKIEGYFKGFAHEPMTIHEELRKQLSGKGGPLPPLPKPPPARTSAPQQELPGWKQSDVGGALQGGLQNLGGSKFALFGGGADVWGPQDEFRFLYQEIEGDFELTVILDEVEDVQQYTKGGLMVRSGLAPNAQVAMLTSFVDAGLQFAFRNEAGKDMGALESVSGNLPGLRLRLIRHSGEISAFYANANSAWKRIGSIPDKLPEKVLAGALALSHDNSRLARIVYRDISIKKG